MDGQLEALLTYTVFHLGVYISLISAVLGAGILTKQTHGSLRAAVFFILIAGMAGGLIGGNIPDFATFEDFEKSSLQFFGIDSFDYATASKIEHGSFWIGVLIPSIAFMLGCLPGKDKCKCGCGE